MSPGPWKNVDNSGLTIEPNDVDRVNKTLNDNAHLNFVQRAKTPDTSPVLINYAGPGTSGTHLMASGEVGGKGVVFPLIIQGADGNLKQLGPREAFDHAIKTGEHIKFDTPGEAEWFGKNYKKAWGGGYNP